MHYTTREDRVDFAKHTDGDWSGEPGNSCIKPNLDTEAGRAAAAKLREFDEKDVRYKDGVVDFSKFAVESVEIPHMTKDREMNRRQAYSALAAKWYNEGKRQDNGKHWTPDAVGKWASDKGLEFHECSDMRTCQLVPKEIHKYFKHYGGIAECKTRDAREGGFDE